MKKLNLAIVGCGQIAQVTHIPNYLQMENVKIIGVCDNNIETAKKVAENLSIDKFYNSYKQIIDDLKPDAVTVCVPNKFHCEITEYALKSGCHVFCEKPPAITYEQALCMQITAEKYNKILSYGFHFRASEHVKVLKERILSGKMGEIYHTEVKWNRRRGIPGWGVFTNKDIQGGGPLIDIGAHMLDCAFYLLDYPEIAYVCASKSDLIGKTSNVGLMGNWDKSKFNIEDGIFGYIQFKNGNSMSLQTTFAVNQAEKDIRSVKLFGDKEGANLFPLEIYTEQDGQLINVNFPFLEMKDWHFNIDENFIKACLGENNLLVTAEQGTYIQKIICALYQSAESGKPVIF